MSWKLFEMSTNIIDRHGELPKELYRTQHALHTLRMGGIEVERLNLLEQPTAFLSEPIASELMEEEGDEAFPILLIDGKLMKKGGYPSSKEWAEWSKIPVEQFPDSFPDSELELWLDLTAASGGGCSSGGCAGCSGCGGSPYSEPDWSEDLELDE